MDCVATFGKYNGFKPIVPKGVEQERKPNADIAKEFANGIMNLMSLNASVEHMIDFQNKVQCDIGNGYIEVAIEITFKEKNEGYPKNRNRCRYQLSRKTI